MVPAGYIAFDEGCLDSAPVLIRKTSEEHLHCVDALIFDLDGVVIDPSESILIAHPLAMRVWLEDARGFRNCSGLVTAADLAAMKLSGSFNDDWNIAAVTSLTYAVKAAWTGSTDGCELLEHFPSIAEVAAGAVECGGGMEGAREWLKRMAPADAYEKAVAECADGLPVRIFKEVVSGDLCREMYGFDAQYVSGDGTIVDDRLLVQRAVLREQGESAIYTGRTYGEARVAMRLLGLDGWVPDDRMITWNDGMPKPDGRSLAILAERLESVTAAFVGDNPDDLRSVLLSNGMSERRILSIQVCGGASAAQACELYAEMGADMLAPDASAALRALAAVRKGVE